MRLTFIGAILISAICACSPSSGEGKDARSESVPSPMSSSSEAKGGNAAMERKSQFIQAAIDSTSGFAGEVVVAEALPPTAVVVRYRKGDIQSVPSSCSVSIVEAMEGKEKVVATNDSVLGCSLASSAEDVKASAKVNVEKDRISIAGEGGKGSSEFDLYRESDGVWYLAKASFTYPEEDPASGDVVVINEAVAFGHGVKALRFSDYSYDAIKGDLSRTSVE